MGDRYYKLIKKHKSPLAWLWDDDVDEILNKDTMVGCIENIQYDWDIPADEREPDDVVEPFYKYALKQAKHN